jgi:hypothetical protein
MPVGSLKTKTNPQRGNTLVPSSASCRRHFRCNNNVPSISLSAQPEYLLGGVLTETSHQIPCTFFLDSAKIATVKTPLRKRLACQSECFSLRWHQQLLGKNFKWFFTDIFHPSVHGQSAGVRNACLQVSGRPVCRCPEGLSAGVQQQLACVLKPASRNWLACEAIFSVDSRNSWCQSV